MNWSTLQRVRREMAKENSRRPTVLTPMPKDQWPILLGVAPVEVWLSSRFLAQVYEEAGGVLRVSVCRTRLDARGQWEENLTWDELMDVKRQIGRAEAYAVEVLPADSKIVNVANMRHFWILREPLVGWL